MSKATVTHKTHKKYKTAKLFMLNIVMHHFFPYVDNLEANTIKGQP